MKKNLILFLILLCNCTFLYAQQFNITGVVTDKKLKEPIIGASVIVKGTTYGTVTDLDGNFTLQVSKGNVLVISFIGYTTQEIKVNENQFSYNIQMSEDIQTLDEVVVVGFGTQRKANLTEAVATVDTKVLDSRPVTNLGQSLQGTIPGLNLSVGGLGGQLGQTMDVNIRGTGTISTGSKAATLVLIDGIEGNMNNLNPDDVESISVLKDASATAVFGVRGANGVIMITTRRGEKGTARISANVEFSMQEIAFKPERLDSWDWVRLRNEALVNDGNSAEFLGPDIDKFDSWKTGNPVDPDFYPNNNWQDILFRDYAPMTRANMNVSGGSDKLQYFVSAGYLHQGGMFNVEPKSRLGYNAQSSLDRYNFRSNIDYKVNKSVKINLNASSYLERINGTSASMSSVFNSALTSRPTSMYLTPEGAYATDAIRTFPIGAGLSVEDPANNSLSAYPLINRSGYQLETRSGINVIGGVEIDLGFITKGLSVKGQVSFDSKGFGKTIGKRSYTWYTYQTLASGEHLFINRHPSLEDEDGPIELTKSSESYWVMNLQGQINYNQTFAGKHNVTAMFLAQRDIKESKETSGDLLLPYNVIGIAGRATYDYDRRYFAEVNVGYNGSEQFSPDKRFGLFPAASFGWLITNEGFLQDNPVLTNLKLRASWGKVGNDAFGSARFLYLDNISQYSVVTDSKGDHWLSPSLGYASNGSGWGQGYKIAENYIGNKSITWETAEKQNYGIDISLYHDLSFSFDYFVEKRKNILIIPQTTPMIQGLPSSALPLMNDGEVKNQGFEMVLGYQKQFKNGLSVSANANFSYAKNKVLEYDEPLLGKDYAYRTRTTGFSLGQNWGYIIDHSYDPEKGRDGTGFFYSDESIAKSGLTYEGVGTPEPGDFIYKDLNGDGVINDRDKAPIGYSSLLPRINYGFSLSANWKGFDVSIMLQGVGQYSKTYSGAGIYESSGNFYKMHMERWSEERYNNHEKITYPRLSSSGGPSLQPNDFFHGCLIYTSEKCRSRIYITGKHQQENRCFQCTFLFKW